MTALMAEWMNPAAPSGREPGARHQPAFGGQWEEAEEQAAGSGKGFKATGP